MITNEQIKKIIENCKAKGYDISVRDMSFVMLCKKFDDSLVAYKCLFGNDKDYNQDYLVSYEKTSAITYLKSYIDMIEEESKKKKKGAKYKDVSFDENKAEIIKLIEETQKALEEGSIKTSDALKIQADLRVKLNDKFNVQEDTKEQIVIVQQKYDDVCSCGREVARRPISKEEAMEMYNLVEKE